jgi:outer membrane protein assembly factor BamA
MIITVDEGPVTIQGDGTVKAGADQSPNLLGVRKRTGWSAMFLPILKFEDGYGLSYGARAALPDVAGKKSRLSFPATWGAEKRAAAEIDKELTSVINRLQAGVGFTRRSNPYLHETDDRGRIWVRGERELTHPLRIGATAEWQHVSFAAGPNRFFRTGADVTFDTRIDPLLSRNAIYARASWDHVTVTNAEQADRSDIDLRGFIGVIGQSVLIVRGQWQGSSRPLPPFLKPLVGGTESLRGFRAGSFVGDTLVGASADLRVPVSSPLSIGKVGVSAFLDTASAYDKGQRVRDQHFQRGVGGGVWLSAAFIRFDLYVAHGLGRSTRAHFATSVLF